ncbi:hypothetical protein [Flavobacterium sp. M31R6]|uniref:hypothetical protein n=1 Tax=Flavobacterium sp. M31R6 TaxID=2739062 RepID=UPI00156868D4|nr:hypothetical protein [Flavobacterium sp. M31R6]QKJ63227.1 hypothetical protein HQN62_08800 [Flavobacterium sp. M31R6]
MLIALFFGVFLTGSFGIILLFNINGNLDYEYKDTRLIIGLTFTLLSIFLFLIILNYFSTIKIDKTSISIISLFKTKIYPINEFEKITISEITEYYGALTDRSCITMKNEEKLDLYSFKYSNFSEFRKFLAVLKGGNIVSDKSKETDTKNDSDFKNIKFNDSHIISFTGITFYVFIVCLLIGIIKNDDFKDDFFKILFSLIVIVQIFSAQMNYFILTKEYLIIKNSIKFWKKDIHKLNNIQSIEINKYYKQPGKSIIIKTYDYKVKEYSSDNLWNKTWIDFKRNIVNKTITIKDNSNFPNRRVTY